MILKQKKTTKKPKKKQPTRSYENFSTDNDEGQIPVVLTHQLNTSV